MNRRNNNPFENQIDSLVAKNIFLLRKQRKISRCVVAKYLEVTQQQYQKYEYNVNKISIGKLVHIANFFEVPVETLYNTKVSN